MPFIPVNVQSDHIAELVAAKRPLDALTELIWNGFDADANRLTVDFEFNSLGSIDTICVSDNGLGIPFTEIATLFGNLGGSWKKRATHSPNGRKLHGQSGKGRYKAFTFGPLVRWETTSKKDDALVDFSIVGDLNQLEKFEYTEPIPSVHKRRGTRVTIFNLQKPFTSIYSDRAEDEIAKIFAIYLTEYPQIDLVYSGHRIDPKSVQADIKDYQLDDVEDVGDGRRYKVELTIIEWKVVPKERTLFICDARGIALHSMPVGIHAPGYHFTAYLKSDLVRKYNEDNSLALEELNPGLNGLVMAAKAKMREHFRKKAAEDAGTLVAGWKDEQIYPYEGEAKDAVEDAERQVFDVLAVNVNTYSKSFNEADASSKKFTFKLLKQALADNPASLRKILSDVLHLPIEKQDEFAKLLEVTSLPSIINAAKVITDRLNFLRGLEALINDDETKDILLERDQLHKIIADETWIFGEEFHLTSNEETLNEVLKKHEDLLGNRSDDDSPVLREGGKQGRLDIVLGRSVLPRSDGHENLVIELKRPNKDIDSTVLSQIYSYAVAVAEDPRFDHTRTKWNFWAVSRKMTKGAQQSANQQGRASGIYFINPESTICVWAKTWGQIIGDCRLRLEFFRDKLNYEATRDAARGYLKKYHDKYLPPAGIGAPDEAPPPVAQETDTATTETNAPVEQEAELLAVQNPQVPNLFGDEPVALSKPAKRSGAKRLVKEGTSNAEGI